MGKLQAPPAHAFTDTEQATAIGMQAARPPHGVYPA